MSEAGRPDSEKEALDSVLDRLEAEAADDAFQTVNPAKGKGDTTEKRTLTPAQMDTLAEDRKEAEARKAVSHENPMKNVLNKVWQVAGAILRTLNSLR